MTKDPEHEYGITLPDIGSENLTIAQLRETIEVQKQDINEKDQKVGAL